MTKTYSENSDGINIFPNLPSMFKTYHSVWKKNSIIKLVHKKMGNEYSALLHRLANSRKNARNKDSEEVNEESIEFQINNNNSERDEILTAVPTNAPYQEKNIPAQLVAMKK